MGERERYRRFIVCVLGLLALAALVAPGTVLAGGPLRGKLDRSFGNGGRAFAALGNTFARSSYSDMVRQPDGGIVVGGPTSTVKGLYNESSGFVQRRHPSGVLDTGFGGGLVKVPAVSDLALQGDGRVLVGVPVEENTCGSTSTVWRLEPSGAGDAGFGDGGVSARLPISVSDVEVDAEGRIVVAGTTHTNACGKSVAPTLALAVARLLPNGTLDRSFGQDGLARAAVAQTYGSGIVHGLAIREDGSILASAGNSLLAFTAAGAPDPSFGKGGVVEVGGSPTELLGLPGGKAVLAGTSADYCCTKAGQFVLSRYLANGTLDLEFGGGSVSLAVGEVDVPTSLAAAPDGSILLGGEAASSDDCPAGDCDSMLLLARFTTAGALDPTFGQSGQAILDLPRRTRSDYAHYAAALALAPSGQILVAGGSGDGDEATVLALQPNGAPDLGFGSGGRASDPQPLPSVTETFGLAIGPSGDILTSAWSDAGAHWPRSVLVGWTPNGAVDGEIGGGSGFVLPETGTELRADGHDRFYTVTNADSGSGRAYVARFDALGRRSLGYGSKGRAEIPPRFDIAALVVRRSGEALVIGRVARRLGMAAFKLTAAGEPDPRFGREGLAFVGWGPKVKAIALSATFDRRGRVVLFGKEGPYAGMARLLPSGRLDPTFAYSGRQWYMPALAGEESVVTMAAGGRILLAASSEPGLRLVPTTLVRFRPDGIRDRSFGRNGVVRVDAKAPLVSFFGGRRLILVSGVDGWGERGVAIRAFRADGRPDRRFGRGGVVRAGTSKAHPFRPAAAARQPNGRLVVAGTTGKLEQSGSTTELLRFR